MSDSRPLFTGAERDESPAPLERPGSRELAVREALPGRSGRQLVVGIAVIGILVACAWFARFLTLLPYVPAERLPLAPWIALLAAIVLAVALVFGSGGRLTAPMLAVLCGAAVVVVGLEIGTSYGLLQLGVPMTAVGAVGMLLAPLTVLGDPRWAEGTGILIGAAALVAALLQAPSAGAATADGVGLAIAGAVPALLTGIAVTGFRRMVGVDLDHSIVQSTVGAGPTLPNAQAGEELASLDYEAERLLDGVASGRIPLPLPPEEAARAARVGAALRIRLIEGRTDTWLKHAVAESEVLSVAVVVDDAEGDAARLGPGARDALLLSLWLLADDRPRNAQVPIRVVVASADRDGEQLVSVDLVIAGGSRRRTDVSTWEAVDGVGRSTTSFDGSDFRISILSRVDPDAPERATRVHGTRQRKAP